MVVSVLVAHKVLSDGLNTNITTDFAVVSRAVIDILGDVFEGNDISIYASSQSLNKLGSSNVLNGTQLLRLAAFVKEEKTTKGVAPFNPVTSLPESARTLSLAGTVIVIAEETDKEHLPTNKRIKSVTPSEFSTVYRAAKLLYEKVPWKEKDFLELLLLCLFRPDFFEEICPPE